MKQVARRPCTGGCSLELVIDLARGRDTAQGRLQVCALRSGPDVTEQNCIMRNMLFGHAHLISLHQHYPRQRVFGTPAQQ
ncbi:hypothetical protein D3C75_1097090 [compost metagenome]